MWHLMNFNEFPNCLFAAVPKQYFHVCSNFYKNGPGFEELCVAQGGTRASINSTEEQKMVEDLLDRNKGLEIQLHTGMKKNENFSTQILNGTKDSMSFS